MTQMTLDRIQERGGDDGGVPGSELPGTTYGQPKIEVRDLNVSYGKAQALEGASVNIPERRISTFVGPSGSGKSTFLRALNRMHDLSSTAQVTGNILLDGEDISLLNRNGVAVVHLRQRVGMLFQRPNVFPLSLFENVAYGVRLSRRMPKRELQALVENVLRRVALWDDVKDRLQQRGSQLSDGQQQLLCLARALALKPEVLLLDEPWGIQDAHARGMLEDLIQRLSEQHTIIVTTSNPERARNISHQTGIFLKGHLTTWGPTQHVLVHSLRG